MISSSANQIYNTCDVSYEEALEEVSPSQDAVNSYIKSSKEKCKKLYNLITSNTSIGMWEDYSYQPLKYYLVLSDSSVTLYVVNSKIVYDSKMSLFKDSKRFIMPERFLRHLYGI